MGGLPPCKGPGKLRAQAWQMLLEGVGCCCGTGFSGHHEASESLLGVTGMSPADVEGMARLQVRV